MDDPDTRRARFQSMVYALAQAKAFAKYYEMTYYVVEKVRAPYGEQSFFVVLDRDQYTGRAWKIITEVKPDA